MRKFKLILLTSLLLGFFAIPMLPQVAYAQSDVPVARCKGRLLGIIPTWYHYLKVDGNCNVQFPTRTVNAGDEARKIDIAKAATSIGFAILDILLRVAGIVAVVFVIVGGFTFITSNGQPEKAKNARNTILNALIGMVIAITAAIIVNIVGKALILP